MRRAVVIGANGQLGSDLVKALRSRFAAAGAAGAAYEVVELRHADLEVCDAAASRQALAALKPDVVFNLSAFLRVDDCEDAADRAFQVNAVAPGNLARICRDLSALFVHISTDYVFGADHSHAMPYGETDLPGPVNVYGTSKLAGEYLVRQGCDRSLVVRTTGLYGVAGSSGKGGNFVETMLRLAGEGKPIRVVDDQRLAPTYTPDLASSLLDLVEGGHHGLFHVVNAGECSWFEFASAIFALAGLTPDLSPTTSAAFPTKAVRPSYSVLACRALQANGLVSPRPWREALADYLLARRAKAR